MKDVCVFLATGFEEIEAITIIDILRRAEISVSVISVTGNIKVTGSHNITVLTDHLFEDFDYKKAEMIILPGGMPGSENLAKHEGLKQLILCFHNKNKLLGAICAAPIVLGQLGILKNREATCYPGFESQLTGAIITGNSVSRSENIITGKGAGVAIEFALAIVELIKGSEDALLLKEKMIVT